MTLPGPPAAAAALDDTHVYVPLTTGVLVALARETGAIAWQSEAASVVAPRAQAGSVYVASKADLRALDAATGATKWRVPLSAPPAGAIALVDDVGFLAVGGTNLMAFDLTSGRTIWQQAVGAAIRFLAATSDSVYASLSDGRVAALASSDGRSTWTRQLNGTLSAPVASGDRLFVGSTDNFLYALDSDDGSVLWRWRSGGDVVGIAVAGDAVFAASRDNMVRSLNRGNGNQRWKHETTTRPGASVLTLGDAVVVSGISPTLSTFSSRTGAPGPVLDVLNGAELRGAPLVDPDLQPFRIAIVALARDGRVLALRPVSVALNEHPIAPLTILPGRPLARETLPIR